MKVEKPNASQAVGQCARPLPKTWRRVPGNDAPGFIAYCTNASKRMSAFLTRHYPRGASVRMGDSIHQYYSFQGGRWTKFFRRRDSDYVAPDAFLIIYGLPGPVGGFVVLRYPGHLTWKVVLPEVKKVGRIYGCSVGGKASSNSAYIDGTEASVWASGKCASYDWNGETFVQAQSVVS